MQVQPVPPAPSAPTVLSAPAPAQIPTAHTAPSPSAPPAHTAQAAPPEQTPVPASPAADGPAPKTAPPVPPVTTPTVADPEDDATDDTTVDHSVQTPPSPETEAEATLSAEIKKLWGLQKDGKASVRRTRAELKALRQQLAATLHAMKAILVRTGRGGGWASYLRAQRLPVTTADRYVTEHEGTLAPREEKLTTGEHSTPTVDEIHLLAQKILPKVSRLLTTQELVYEFVHELVWNIDVAEAWYTDKGLEIPKIGSDDARGDYPHGAESANPAPAVPDGAVASL